jgi:branched-chain amino acid aminotransferase
MYMSLYTFVNDEMLPAHEASVRVSDLAVQRGYGIFDFFKTINHQPVFLDDHLDRFYHSAAEMHLQVLQNRTELKATLNRLIEKNNIPYSGIRLTLTGGYSADGYQIAQPNLIITQQPLTVNPAPGIRLMTYPHQRQFAHVKTIDYIMSVWLQPLLKHNGANDILYHHNGALRECPRSNFFLVTANEQVLTSGRDVLKGIIRKQLLSLNGQGFTVLERDITLDDLQTCSEAFITSTTKNILPVTHIDGKPVGNGKPGAVSQALLNRLKDWLS